MHPRAHAETRPDKPAFIMADTGETVTYRELEQSANQIAHLFRKLGMNSGDHIGILLENEPLFIKVVWAAQRTGLVYTCISTHMNADDASYILENCEARLLVTASSYLEQLGDLRGRVPHLQHTLLTDGSGDDAQSLLREMQDLPVTPVAHEQAGVDMLYSSGTTGRPKGVSVQLESEAIEEMLPVMKGLAKLYGIDRESVYLSTAPLYHAAPLRFNLLVMSQGGTCIIMPRFEGEAALALIEAYRVTHSQWVPIMFTRMLKAGLARSSRRDLASHRVAIHAAAPCPPEVKRAMIDWWGPILHEYYSSTEGIGFTAINSHEWLSHPGSVGRSVVGEVRILDELDVKQPPNTTGLIYFANGPGFSYFRDAKKTAGVTNAAGWYTVGDIGYVDDEGYLYLTDRQSFMIISGGVNIYPQEIENILINHPDVKDVAVFGVPSEQFGEEVKAVIEPASHNKDTAVLAERLTAFCREKISAIKCPRSIDFIAEMPRLPNGKLYKKQLRGRYWQ